MTQAQKNLLSLTLEHQWQEMSSQQKQQLVNKVKADAAVKLIQANQCVEAKNIARAKQLLIHIGDSCACIKQPDQQILKWYEFSCNYLAILYKQSMQKDRKPLQQIQEEHWENRNYIIVLKYNKFSGEFQFQKSMPTGQLTKQIQQQVIKLNSILFGMQNVQGNHSLLVMLETYWVSFLMALILAIMMAMLLILHPTVQEQFNLANNNADLILMFVLSSLFLIPMIIIYCKEPMYHNDEFFQKKLGEQIKKINDSLKIKGKKILFKIPHGSEINIIIEHIEQSEGIQQKAQSQTVHYHQQI